MQQQPRRATRRRLRVGSVSYLDEEFARKNTSARYIFLEKRCCALSRLHYEEKKKICAVLRPLHPSQTLKPLGLFSPPGGSRAARPPPRGSRSLLTCGVQQGQRARHGRGSRRSHPPAPHRSRRSAAARGGVREAPAPAPAPGPPRGGARRGARRGERSLRRGGDPRGGLPRSFFPVGMSPELLGGLWSCQNFQGWGLQHFPRQPVSMPHNPFIKEVLLNIQPKFPQPISLVCKMSQPEAGTSHKLFQVCSKCRSTSSPPAPLIDAALLVFQPPFSSKTTSARSELFICRLAFERFGGTEGQVLDFCLCSSQ